jgi:hypothetical protein
MLPGALLNIPWARPVSTTTLGLDTSTLGRRELVTAYISPVYRGQFELFVARQLCDLIPTHLFRFRPHCGLYAYASFFFEAPRSSQ